MDGDVCMIHDTRLMIQRTPLSPRTHSVPHFSFFKDFTPLAIDLCISIQISFIIVSLV